MRTYNLEQVIEEETELIERRRERLFGPEAKENLESEKFGIALSGGGIRSAIINLGFLKTLNRFNILKKADYLSTVSGGGYTGAYVQAAVKNSGSFETLFSERDENILRDHGAYFIPGQGKIIKLWNTVLLTVGFLVSWVMSLLSPVVTILLFYLVFKSVISLGFPSAEPSILDWNNEGNQIMTYLYPAFWTLGGIGLLHFVLNLTMNFNLNISKFFTKIESLIILGILLFLIVTWVITLDKSDDWSVAQVKWAMLLALGLFLLGYVLNPNSLSFHRYYRKQLADAFLSHTGRFSNMPLKNVFKTVEHSKVADFLAPYPLINTCLNLQNPGEEDKFKGVKTIDYYLLSPKFCGSKLSNYVKTAEFPGYKHLTLPAAITISAAAVNPGMGIYSNKLLSIIMTLFNARLGFWVNNPGYKTKKEKREEEKKQWAIQNDVTPVKEKELSRFAAWRKYTVWWPSYFFKELFSKIGTTNPKLNISDGGHIENLAVFELLRRKCRLIIAVDAGADPKSTFADLENLTLRARNELGIEIVFRQGYDPVENIRPKAPTGYAQKRFAIADLMKIWEEFEVLDENNEPIIFKQRYVENGEIKVKSKKLEAVVNYFYSKKDKNILKFKLNLKAIKGIDFTEEHFDELHDLAVATKMAELNGMTEKKGSDKIKVGTLVYIKPSITSSRKLFIPTFLPNGEENKEFFFQRGSYKYKIHHPEFPHESTADQFFDPVQWESYFQLGQFIGSDILSLNNPPSTYRHGEYDISIRGLLNHFDTKQALFKSEDKMEFLMDVSQTQTEPETTSREPLAPVQSEPEEAPVELPEDFIYDPEFDAVKEENIIEEMQFKI